MQEDCAGGAAGAVTAELVAEWTQGKLMVLSARDSSSWTPEDVAREARKLQVDLDNFKQKGVDVAALTGGLTSALVSGKVDSGATAGGNAVENNQLSGVEAGCTGTSKRGLLRCVAGALLAVAGGANVSSTSSSDDDTPGIGHNGGPPLDDDASADGNANDPNPKGPHPSAYLFPGVAAFEVVKALASGKDGKVVEEESVDDILKPNGAFVGEVSKGATPNIRTVSASEFTIIKNSLLSGAQVSGEYAGGKGVWYDLHTGGRVGVRVSESSGVTLDIDIPGYPKGFKVHHQ